MRCSCGADLVRPAKDGSPMMRNHGLKFTASGPVAVCPSCKGDVPLGADMCKALVLLFNAPARRG